MRNKELKEPGARKPRMEIKEVIVVEGKDDISRVKKAVNAEMIATGGFSMPEKVMQHIEGAARRKGIIILTDPDYPGEYIRREVTKRVKDAKHAFIPKEEALGKDNVGVENASPRSIIEALKKARCQTQVSTETFTKKDLLQAGLIGFPGSVERRDRMGKILGLGYGNAKQFLNRLNHYGVSREEWNEALETLEKEEASGKDSQ